MEVSLYMYDLSRGLVRMMSASLIGVQLDAMYHTSIVLEGVEYVRCVPDYTKLTSTLLTHPGI
jgi:hypothetical protein